MKIKDITIKKIEKLPPHMLARVSEFIDMLAGKKHKNKTAKDRKGLKELGARSRSILAGIKGDLSDDIIRYEREDRL